MLTWKAAAFSPILIRNAWPLRHDPKVRRTLRRRLSNLQKLKRAGRYPYNPNA